MYDMPSNTMLMCIGELNYVEWSRNGSNYYGTTSTVSRRKRVPFRLGPVRHRTPAEIRRGLGPRLRVSRDSGCTRFKLIVRGIMINES